MVDSPQKRRIEVITSFSDKGYEQYGERFLNTFLEFWDAEISLTVYVDTVPEHYVGRNCLQFRKCENVPALTAFKERHKDNPEAHGLIGDAYCMLFDAVKFSHKSLVMCHAAANTTADILIWIDADTVTHDYVTADWLRSLLPDTEFMAWLNRDHKYPECGFLMFNTKRYQFNVYFQKVKYLYENDTIFNLKETHDSYIWQYVANWLDERPVKLSGEYSGCNHPFVNVFGHVMDHLKGFERKENGKSLVKDLKTTRTEMYWHALRA